MPRKRVEAHLSEIKKQSGQKGAAKARAAREEQAESKKEHGYVTKPKKAMAAAFSGQLQRMMREQYIDANSSPVIAELKAMSAGPGNSHRAEAALAEQVKFLSIRHLYVAKRMKPSAIAREMDMAPHDIYDMVDMYSWQDEKRVRDERRHKRFTSTGEVNAYVVEKRSDLIYAKVQAVIMDLLDDHLDGHTRLKPSEVQSIANTAETAFKIRGAINGSDKVGEKIDINMTHEVRNAISEVFKKVSVEEVQTKQLPVGLEIEDAEFDEVTG